MVYLLEYVYAKFDGFVKCRNDIVFVIPANPPEADLPE
jgi:hypothetical protein